jgi:hypothetical protein
MNSAELKKKYPKEWDAIRRAIYYAWERRCNDVDRAGFVSDLGIMDEGYLADAAACAGCIQLHERITRKQKRKRAVKGK